MGKHKVKKGETLSKIAKSYGLSLQELLDLNGISADKANHITIGQELVTDKNMRLPDFSKSFKLSGFTPYESSTAEAVIPYTPRSKEENDTILLQRQLQAKGYDLGKYGVDGKMGKVTKAALQQAIADGFKYENGMLVKESAPKKSRSSVPMYGVHPMFGFNIPEAEKVEKPATPTKGRAIYLNYPNFKGKASNALKVAGFDVGKAIFGNGNVLPVGHGETLLIDANGKVKYVRYGRYTSGTGKVRPGVKGGNWGIYDYPDIKQGESVDAYLNRLLELNKNGGNYLEDSKYGDFEAIEIPNVDFQNALAYATEQSQDADRPEYSIFNTCATGACNTIKAGLSTLDKAKTLIPTFSSSEADQDLKTTAWGWLPGTTNKYAQDMRDLGTSYIIKPR